MRVSGERGHVPSGQESAGETRLGRGSQERRREIRDIPVKRRELVRERPIREKLVCEKLVHDVDPWRVKCVDCVGAGCGGVGCGGHWIRPRGTRS